MTAIKLAMKTTMKIQLMIKTAPIKKVKLMTTMKIVTQTLASTSMSTIITIAMLVITIPMKIITQPLASASMIMTMTVITTATSTMMVKMITATIIKMIWF